MGCCSLHWETNLTLVLGLGVILSSILLTSSSILLKGPTIDPSNTENFIRTGNFFKATDEFLPMHPIVKRLNFDQTVEEFKASAKRVLVLDFDGTMVHFHPNPQKAVPIRSLRKFLEVVNKDKKTLVAIISGRDQAFMDEELGMYNNFILSAEHGAFIKYPNQDFNQRKWIDAAQNEKIDMGWMKGAKKILERIINQYKDQLSKDELGKALEVKKTGLVFHYRAIQENNANLAEIMADQVLNQMAKFRGEKLEKGIQLIMEHDAFAIDIRPKQFTKGVIATRCWDKAPDANVLICIGDGKTDEPMFTNLKNYQTERLTPSNLFTIHVNNGKNKPTEAEYQLADVDAVIYFLRSLVGLKPEDNILEKTYKSLITNA